ncbi:hypothetical protein [Shewanella salipaludis]|uniref:Uncharacterized protein n=1 Tax=Shewanella salipaludis TaxID=2723052 RepID=A0A972JHG8_9GAMM|nr:hypothetical protein [Shewanella salipaludis]NMH63983.1 hypothetical protein [Shewanella salipaludis]
MLTVLIMIAGLAQGPTPTPMASDFDNQTLVHELQTSLEQQRLQLTEEVSRGLSHGHLDTGLPESMKLASAESQSGH